MREYWELVSKIVEARGCHLKKYSFFEEVWKALSEGSRFLVIRAPTGCGKTEAVFTPFAHALANNTDSPWFSMVYALPTRSLVFSMAKRFSKALKASGVRHATVTVNYSSLFTLSPFLEGDIAVATYDTLLYAFYGALAPGYHILLPMSKTVGSLVVFDEIQLLQDVFWYGLSILPYHVSNLLRFGADVIIMSATIPSVLREELLRVAKAEGGAEPREIVSSDRPARGNLKVEVRENPLPEGQELVELIREAEEKDYFPVLIVVNTVEKAARVYTTLLDSKLNVEPLLLHSRLRAGARRSVEELFEEGDLRGRRLVIVSTQVVEAGLDLDVRLLLTELSPIDSLIQRLGRCARRSDGEAIVFKDPGGGRYIYPKILLESTQELVSGRDCELQETVRDVHKAQSFVDDVYRRSIIEKLTEEVKDEIAEIKRLVSYTFPSLLFSIRARERIRKEPLLRLGAELDGFYASGDIYQRLLSFEKVEIPISELTERIVRLSLRGREIPTCLLHDIGGVEKVVVLEIESVGEGTVALHPKPVDYSGASLHLSRQVLFLLNFDSYRIHNGYELGVVRCEYRSAKR